MARSECTTHSLSISTAAATQCCVNPSDIDYFVHVLFAGMSSTRVPSECHRNRSLGCTRRLKGWFWHPQNVYGQRIKLPRRSIFTCARPRREWTKSSQTHTTRRAKAVRSRHFPMKIPERDPSDTRHCITPVRITRPGRRRKRNTVRRKTFGAPQFSRK